MDWSIKDLFLDRYAVARTMDSNTLKFLSKFGANTRTTMQQSIRYSDKPSAPGSPPHAHRKLNFTREFKKKDGSTGSRATSPIKELIFFALDEATKSVWIGPIGFGPNPGVIPRILNEGGVIASHKNPRRRKRVLNGVGEIRLGGGSASSRFVPEVGWVTYAKLTTQAQVDRANEFNKAIYGPDRVGGGRIQPRPFSKPALDKNLEQADEIWAKAVA